MGKEERDKAFGSTNGVVLNTESESKIELLKRNMENKELLVFTPSLPASSWS